MLGWLNPTSGEVREIPLGTRSAPHGVIVGPDGAAWVTDGGQNAIVRVDPLTNEVRLFPLPIKPGTIAASTGCGKLVLVRSMAGVSRCLGDFRPRAGSGGRLFLGTSIAASTTSPTLPHGALV